MLLVTLTRINANGCIDGIKNKIDPGKTFDRDLYRNLRMRLKNSQQSWIFERQQNLDKDRTFLTQGVFTDDQIDAYIEKLKKKIYNFEHFPRQRI